MPDYTLTHVSPRDKHLLSEIDALLFTEGLTRDRNLDYICAALDDEEGKTSSGYALQLSANLFDRLTRRTPQRCTACSI